MTKKKKAAPKIAAPKQRPAKLPFVVYGIDQNGKTKGARFPAEQFEQAAHASTSMGLQIHEAHNDELIALAQKLPSGRIYARGRAFIPFIKRELYDRLHAATGGLVRDAVPVGSTGEASTEQIASDAGVMPRTWDAVAPGHTVLAKSAVEDEGYFEAIVLSRDGATLALQYRDFPNEKKIERHISSVGLLNPGPEVAQ